MFFATLQLMMGKIVRFLSGLYGEYSKYINFVVLIYGISLIWVHNNLRTAIRRMEQGMVHYAKEQGSKLNVKEVFRNFSKRWTDQNKDKQILIPSKKDIWFEKVNSAELLKILNINADYVKMALHKNLGKPERGNFPTHHYIAWDEYRHGLVRGIRKRFVDPKEIKERLEKKQGRK